MLRSGWLYSFGPSRHRSSLHFQLPLTLTAKVVIGSFAVAGAIALLSYGAHRRRTR